MKAAPTNTKNSEVPEINWLAPWVDMLATAAETSGPVQDAWTYCFDACQRTMMSPNRTSSRVSPVSR